MKNITGILLVLVISITGIPCFLVEDASHNGTVDLQDVILQVQDFTASAESSGSFTFRFEKMLNTLSSVAGLKTLIGPDKAKKSSNHQTGFTLSIDRIVEAFSIEMPPLLSGRVNYPENSISFQSRTPDPSVPPPRQA